MRTSIKKMITLILTTAFILSTISCSYGYDKKISFTKINNSKDSLEVYSKNKGHVDVYWDGSKPDIDFNQIGFIEAVGNENSDLDELLLDLRHSAWRAGADAIINVKRDFKTRRAGIYFDLDGVERYESMVLSGLAVKYKTDIDSNAINPESTSVDSSLVNYYKNKKKETEDTALLLIGLTTIAIIIIAIFKLNMTENKDDQNYED
ncbi:MAG: hypothetical protein JXR48_18350 [Candidatus Delongbacteria bacterium]|nr:hypothetical protein [Candidatus Delongbacteria bacterium]MBN2836922.1 hypothetical protein [Candidatus Delongbacteria bacterium]